VGPLLYGAGLRLLEALRLRVKDVDFGPAPQNFPRRPPSDPGSGNSQQHERTSTPPAARPVAITFTRRSFKRRNEAPAAFAAPRSLTPWRQPFAIPLAAFTAALIGLSREALRHRLAKSLWSRRPRHPRNCCGQGLSSCGEYELAGLDASMPRRAYVLAMLLVSACAGSESAGRPPVQSGGSPDPPAKEDVPEWLKKKPAGDPSVDAFRERMAEEHRQLLRHFDDMAAAIDFANGIDASEAELIAGAYFSMEFGVCGGPEKPSDGGAEWVMHPRVGVTGQALSEFIRVDKRTGAVRYGSGPTTEAKAAIDFERQRLQKNVERFSKARSSGEPANRALHQTALARRR
jgi:hypothetical protein